MEETTGDDQYRSRIRRILKKLENVRTRGLSCFGSDSHNFKLAPPLDEAAIAAFETEHGIRLPADYRCFLQHAGNGGAGPYYGLYPLEQWNDLADWILDPIPADLLARPSPLRPGWNPAPIWGDDDDEDSTLPRERVYQGTLSIGTQGCTFMNLLVVSGSYAGHVAYTDVGDEGRPYLLREPGFLSWYERWLDELLSGYAMTNFGFGPSGGPTEYFAILDDPQSSEEEKIEAAEAFQHLPTLFAATGEHLMEYVSHPVAKVRAVVLEAAHEFCLVCSDPVIANAIDDPAPVIRTAAYVLGMTRDPDRWRAAFLSFLSDDPDTDAANEAFHAIHRHTRFTRKERIALLYTVPRLRQGIMLDMTWKKGDRALLLSMLDDDDCYVRAWTARALCDIGTTKATTSALLAALSRETARGPVDAHVIDSFLRALAELGDETAVPALLEWAYHDDDFHRLYAVEALVSIGDIRAAPPARALLAENRKPKRKNPNEAASLSHILTLAELARQALKKSPNRALRALVKKSGRKASPKKTGKTDG